MSVALVIPVPLRAMTPAGVFLPSTATLVPLTRLAGAQLADRDRGGVQRLEGLHPYLGESAAMRWAHMQRAATARMRDGGLALLLFAGLEGPCAEVLALPVVRAAGSSGEGGAFTVLLGRMLARHAQDGQVQVADGDLAWLHPRLDPVDDAYFGRGPRT